MAAGTTTEASINRASLCNACIIAVLGALSAVQSLKFGKHVAKSLPDELLPARFWNSIHKACQAVGDLPSALLVLLPVTLLFWTVAFHELDTPLQAPSANATSSLAAARTYYSSSGVAVALAPIGAVCRYHLSALNGRWRPSFPLGTFAANFGGVLLAAVLAAVPVISPECSPVSRTWLAAAGTGISGSLSTVSTFVNEIDGASTPSHVGGLLER